MGTTGWQRLGRLSPLALPGGDKAALDVAFGIVDGTGKLPFALPASDGAAASQLPDVPGDGADPTYVRGFGLQTKAFSRGGPVRQRPAFAPHGVDERPRTHPGGMETRLVPRGCAVSS